MLWWGRSPLCVFISGDFCFLRGSEKELERLEAGTRPRQCGQLDDFLHPIKQTAGNFWEGKGKWAGEVLRGQEQVFN